MTRKSRYLTYKVRGHKSLFFLWWPLLVCITLACFSILASSIFARARRAHFADSLNIANLWLFITFSGGIFFGIAANQIRRYGWRELIGIFKPTINFRAQSSTKSRWGAVVVCLLIAVVVFASISLSAYINPKVAADVKEEKYEDTFANRLWLATIRDPGGIFALFTGLATLFALVLTLRSLMDMRRTVVSFTDLIYRLCGMLDDASSDNPFRMVCYTPALGCLALREKDYKMFFNRLCRMEDDEKEPRAEIICLGPDELEDWHRRLKGRS